MVIANEWLAELAIATNGWSAHSYFGVFMDHSLLRMVQHLVKGVIVTVRYN